MEAIDGEDEEWEVFYTAWNKESESEALTLDKKVAPLPSAAGYSLYFMYSGAQPISLLALFFPTTTCAYLNGAGEYYPEGPGCLADSQLQEPEGAGLRLE